MAGICLLSVVFRIKGASPRRITDSYPLEVHASLLISNVGVKKQS